MGASYLEQGALIIPYGKKVIVYVLNMGRGYKNMITELTKTAKQVLKANNCRVIPLLCRVYYVYYRNAVKYKIAYTRYLKMLCGCHLVVISGLIPLIGETSRMCIKHDPYKDYGMPYGV